MTQISSDGRLSSNAILKTRMIYGRICGDDYSQPEIRWERIGQVIPSESPASTICSLPPNLYQTFSFLGLSGAGS